MRGAALAAFVAPSRASTTANDVRTTGTVRDLAPMIVGPKPRPNEDAIPAAPIDLSPGPHLKLFSLATSKTETLERVEKQESSSRNEAAQHQGDHGNVQHGFAVGEKEFEVLGQSPTETQPAEGPLHHPAPGKHVKALEVVGALHDLELDGQLRPEVAYPLDELPGVGAVRPDMPEIQPASAQGLEDDSRSIAILHVGRMNTSHQDQAECIDKDVPLAAFRLFAGVVAFGAPLSVVLTDWLSRIAALGAPSRPSLRRTCHRSSSWMRCHVPSADQAAKYLNTEFQGGKSCGSARHAHPVRRLYRMASTTSFRVYVAGRPPRAVPHFAGPKRGSIRRNCSSVRSLGYAGRVVMQPYKSQDGGVGQVFQRPLSCRGVTPHGSMGSAMTSY